MKEYIWRRIDTPSVMFSALSTKKWGRTCRVAVVLKDLQADEALIKQAAEDLRARFPHYYSKLKRGFFWNYLEQADGAVEVCKESQRPVRPIVLHSDNRPDFRLVYSGNRIALEWAHYITDGVGGMTYLKSFVQRYLELAVGIPSQAHDGILYWKDAPSQHEQTDFFSEYGKYDGEAIKEPLKEVYRQDAVFEKDYLQLMYLKTDAASIKERSDFYSVTATEYMTAAVMMAFLRTAKEPICKPIGVDIPVDLRRIMGADTLRNFVYQVSTLYEPNGRRDCTLQEIADVLRGQVKAQLDPENLRGILKGLTTLAANKAVKVIPNFIKTPVLRVAQARSHSDETTIITNLGLVTFPQSMQEHINHLEFVNGDTSDYGLPATCSMIACNGTFVFCISSSNRNVAVWRELVHVLQEDGVSVCVEVEQGYTEKMPDRNVCATKNSRFSAEKCKAYFHR